MNNLTYRKQFTKHDNDVQYIFEHGLTIKEALVEANVPVVLEHNIHVTLDGEFIPHTLWDIKVPTEKSLIRVTLVPSGGDNSGILRLVAAVAISFVAPYLTGLTVGIGASTAWTAWTGAAFWGAMAINVGITVLGALLLNALFPPPDLPGLGDSGAGSPALSARSGNSARLNGPVQRIYGYMKCWPPLAAQPFTISEGGDQYLYQLFDFGYGPIQLTDLKIGDTAIEDYNEVEYHIHTSITGPDPLVWYTNDVETEVVNANMEDTDINIRTTPTEMKYVQLDIVFPGGLIAFDTNANKLFEQVNWKIQVKNDLGTYINAADYDFSGISASGVGILESGSTGTETLFYISAITEDGFTCTLTLNNFPTTNTDFVTVELTRVSSSDNGTTQINTASYSAIRTFKLGTALNDFRIINETGPVRVSHTMVEMRIKATDQLNGALDTFNAMCHSLLRTWDGTQFVDQYTSNPAWVYADLLTGSVNQRPKDDNKVFWNKLKLWADSNDELVYMYDENNDPLPGEKKHTCNFIFDYEETLLNIIKAVASVGRATFDIRDDYYSVIFDEPKDTKVQVFTNMNTSGFSSSRIYMDLPDAIKISFVDPQSEWQLREIIAYNDFKNANNSKVYEEISSPMTTSHNEAWRLGRYWLKQAALRQETVTINIDLDWLECSRGDYVGVQMDVMKTGGTVSRIISVDGTEVILESNPTLNGNNVAYFELRPNNGPIISGPVAFYLIEDAYKVDLGITGASVGDLILFNSTGQQSYDMLVKQISVNPDLSAVMTLIEYASELFDPESDLIPVYDPAISGSNNPSFVPPILVSLTATQELTYTSGLPFLSIKLSWIPDNGVIAAIYRVYRQDSITAEWLFIGNTSERYFYWKEDLLAVDNPILGVQQCFSVVAVSTTGEYLDAIFGKQVCITPTGDTTVPELLDYFVVEDTAEHFRRFWWEYQEIEQPVDFAGVLMRYTRGIDNWDSATPLHDGLLVQPPFEIRALPEGTQSILLRCVDTSGNISIEHAKIIFGLGDRILENVVLTHDLRYPIPNAISEPSDLGHSNWIKINSLVDTNVTTPLAPDGSQTVDRLKDDNGGGSSTVYAYYTVTVESDVDTTFSAHLQKDGLNWGVLTTSDFDAGATASTYFDLLNGQIGTIGANHSNATIESIGNDWFKCSVTFKTVTDLTGTVAIRLADADVDGIVDRDNTSSIFVWEAVVNTGSEASYYWPGETILGSNIIDSNKYLEADPSTTGSMWNSNIATLMWGTVTELMWKSAYEGFIYIDMLTTTEDGITNLFWTGQGEFGFKYFEGTWPDDFRLVYDIINRDAASTISPDKFDLRDPGWTSSNATTLTANYAYSANGRFDAYRMQDTSAIAAQSFTHSFSANPLIGYSITVYIEKDTNQDRFPELALQLKGGTTQYKYTQLNTQTGALTDRGSVGTTFSSSTLIDNRFWRFHISVIGTASTDNATALISPAITDTAGTLDVTTIGEINIWSFIIMQGEIIAYDALGEMNSFGYIGAGQGLIPYTSPIFLSANDYGLIIECPITTEISSIESLDWIVDVPDVNEVIYDYTTASGGSVITLTKTYTQITAVSLTLQTFGTAVTAEVTAKTPATPSITVQCFDSGGTGVAGLVDIRVQGY